MPIQYELLWSIWEQHTDKDIKDCVKVAEILMGLLDRLRFYGANYILDDAINISGLDIMPGQKQMIVHIVSEVHSKGFKFKKEYIEGGGQYECE